MSPEWVSPLIAAAVPIMLGLVGYGVLKNRVETTQRALGYKAEKEVVSIQYATILERLGRIERKLDASNGAR